MQNAELNHTGAGFGIRESGASKDRVPLFIPETRIPSPDVMNQTRPRCDRLVTMNDDELIAAVGAGDQMALKLLFERHAPWIAGRLRRTLPVDAVEDVVQETFIAVWRGAGTYAGGGEVGGWLWGIARRQAVNWLRKHRRLAPVIVAGAAGDPAAVAIARADLQQAVETLGLEEQELMRLLYVEDRPVAEVAQALDIPAGTVKSRAFRLRQTLRAALGIGEGR
jgi:RNA polymerase sigma-70 factor (ECF subfamily)